MKELTKEDYTVGWICALPNPEWKASRILLDEEHKTLALGRAHKHQYVYGSMNGHNVVMGCLPAEQLGKASAAAVAAEMGSTFPSLRFGLLVGVGGGVPVAKDIRLGDVVVSLPDRGAQTGGVVQYDYGKALSGGEFEPMGMLNQPPEILLSAIGKVQSAPRKSSQFIAYLESEDFKEEPDFAERPQTDRLFDATYLHISGKSTCSKCDITHQVERQPRRTADPVVHYGTIASGDQVMKDGVKRNAISQRLGDVLCFEMEAAGLVNPFPCLVVRGICDYCDSHKSKDWQPFAAAAAAAWAKELLRNIAPADVIESATIGDFIQVKQSLQTITLNSHEAQLKSWLGPPDPSTNRNKTLELRHQGTGSWLLQSDWYMQWKGARGGALWLHGIPGCGKTVLSTTVIEDMESETASSQGVLLYFYFDFNETSKQSFDKMVRCLIFQLYQQHEGCQMHLQRLYSSSGDGHEQPPHHALLATLNDMLDVTSGATIVLDALDECKTQRELLTWLAASHAQILRILLTSCRERDIDSSLSRWMLPQRVIDIEQQPVDEDIRNVVRAVLAEDDDLRRWQDRPHVLAEIEDNLMAKADGMFRWVTCQLDSLRRCRDLRSLRRALSELPDTLDETYERILKNIAREDKPAAIRILQFLIFSSRPLRLEEAVDVVAVSLDEEVTFKAEYRMPRPVEVAACCSSLVRLVTRETEYHEQRELGKTLTEIQLAHFSVKEYLISDRVERAFKPDFEESCARAEIVRVSIAYLSVAASSHLGETGTISHPFADYCARYWMEHAAIAEASGADVCKWSVQCLTQRELFEYWLSLHDPAPTSTAKTKPAALYYASFGGLVRSVKFLLDSGANVDAQGGNYGNALSAASTRGHQAVVRLLLDKGADVNAQGELCGNALSAASLEGHEAVVRLLLDKGADINAGRYVNALSAASMEGHEGLYGNALSAASIRGHEAVVRLLLDKGADINAQAGDYGNALSAASMEGHEAVVRLLLDKGADINAQAGDYGNALSAASMEGYEAVVRLLLDKGADVNAQAGDYGNALSAASMEGHEAVVRLLLDKGADINAQAGDYGNALSAASMEGHEAVVRLLLDKGADINAQAGDYGNALSAASERGDEAIVRLLLEKGADINAQGGPNGNALSAASIRGHKAIVRLLLDNGANVDAQGGSYGNALSAASERGDEAIVRLLLEKGADINAQGGSYGNALSAASAGLAVMRQLLGKDADINALGGWWLQAVRRYEAVAQLLLENGAIKA